MQKHCNKNNNNNNNTTIETAIISQTNFDSPCRFVSLSPGPKIQRLFIHNQSAMLWFMLQVLYF